MRFPKSIIVVAFALPSMAEASVVLTEVGDTELSFEGALQMDANRFDNDIADLNGDRNNGHDWSTDVRRAELILKGKGPGNFDWTLGYDAKADKYLDVNLRYRFGDEWKQFVQIGQFKQFNSMDELSSTRYGDFVSKATVTNTYAVSRRLGIGYGISNERFGFSASYFGRELTRDLNYGNGYALRGSWSPINEKGRLLHLGLAYANHEAYKDSYRLRARPNADLATVRLVDTKAMDDADRVSMTSAEALWVNGPFKVQGEYFRGRVTRHSHSDFDSSGYYLSGLWNVTGETWGYKNGVPTTSNPDDPIRGLWQLGLRYDRIDLNDGTVRGGEMSAWTIGANWYWRANYKVMLNYVMVDSRRAGLDDDPNILEARVQFHW